MKRALLSLCLLAACALPALPAEASGIGPYMTMQAGGTWVEDADVEYDGVSPADLTLEAEFDAGYRLAAALGYDYGLLRLEGEFAYRENDVDSFSGRFLGTPFAFAADGDVSATSFMFNGFWDLETGSPMTPYLGAGIGLANVSYDDVVDDVGAPFIDDDDTVLAFQFAAGLAFEVTPVLTLDLGYRYFATDDPELEDAFGDSLETEYKSHNASVGLRFMY